MKKWLKENWQIIVLRLIFETVATLLTVFTSNKFYLYNFSYIGTCLAIGVYLYVHMSYCNIFKANKQIFRFKNKL